MLAWIERHQDASQVLGAWAGVGVAFLGVIVAVVYAWLTHRIATEAKKQADTTRAMFEAGHRPYVLMPSVAPSFGPNDAMFPLQLENRGSTPAVITAFRATLRQGERILVEEEATAPQLAQVIFQGGGAQSFWRLDFSGPQAAAILSVGSVELELEAIISYRGLGSQAYSTRIVFQLRRTQVSTSWGWKEVQLDPRPRSSRQAGGSA